MIDYLRAKFRRTGETCEDCARFYTHIDCDEGTMYCRSGEFGFCERAHLYFEQVSRTRRPCLRFRRRK